MTKYLLEIKNRILLLFITYTSTILITYLYKETLLFSIANFNFKFEKNEIMFSYFIFTNVTEIFSVYLKLTLFIGFQSVFIFLVYHFFVFFNPALFKMEYVYFKLLVKIVNLSWIISMFFANYFIIPLTWNFFLSFQDLIIDKSFSLHFEAKLCEYIDFYISLYYICGFYFQIFILLFFTVSYVVLNKKNIKKFRKLYFFSFVIFSTLVSPPDIISQFLISIFLIIFYELLLFLFLFNLTRQPIEAN